MTTLPTHRWEQLRSAEQVAAMRGKSVEELLG